LGLGGEQHEVAGVRLHICIAMPIIWKVNVTAGLWLIMPV
jgi:hypothetical protein